MKRALLLVPLLALLAGCGQTALPDPPPTSSTAATSSTAEIPAPTPATSETPDPAPPPAATSPATAAEPYIVECLEGAPGPALFSDGHTRFSDWCAQRASGATTLEAEGDIARQAPTGTTSTRGYSCDSDGCYWPDGSNVAGADRCGVTCGEAPTSGEMQLKNGCQGGHITDPALCADPWWE